MNKFLVKSSDDTEFYEYDTQKEAEREAAVISGDGDGISIYKLVKTGKVVAPDQYVAWDE